MDESEISITLSKSQKKRFNVLLKNSRSEIRQYDGVQAKYRTLMQRLIELESWMGEFTHPQFELTRTALEECISRTATDGGEVVSINSLLDDAIKHFASLMNSTLSGGEVADSMGIVHITTESVLIRPQTQRPKTGSGAGWEKAEFQPRVQHLIQALQYAQIFIDDLIITTGTLEVGMMRQESYTLLEIPRIAKEVSVCNQVGEATFVSHHPLGLGTYRRLTKEELEVLPGVERIICRNLDQWAQEVIAAVVRDVPGDTQKIDVKSVASVRAFICETLGMTTNSWLQMPPNQRQKFSVEGKRMYALGSLFGVSSDVEGYERFLETGVKIFGEGESILTDALQKYSQDRAKFQALGSDQDLWRAEILSIVPTAAGWLSMKVKDRQKFEIAGVGLFKIAAIMGVKGRPPPSNVDDHIVLGAAIYGEQDAAIAKVLPDARIKIAARNSLGRDLAKWKSELIQRVPTFEEWAQMGWAERRAFKVEGKGLASLATMFHISNSYRAADSTEVHLAFGQLLYGISDRALQPWLTDVVQQKEYAKQWESMDVDAWRSAIMNKIPTGEQWVETSMKRNALHVVGKGLSALGTVFGVGGNPASSRAAYIVLGAAIYGENDPAFIDCVEEARDEMEAEIELGKDPAVWKKTIQEIVPTFEAWVKMTGTDIQHFSIRGKKLRALGTIFGFDQETNLGTIDNFLALGARIFEIEASAFATFLDSKREKVQQRVSRNPFAADVSSWSERIQREYPTAQDWMTIPHPLESFAIEESPLRAIAKGCGIGGYIGNLEALQLMVGKIVYGDDPVIIAHFEPWATAIKAQVHTAQAWVALNIEQRVAIEVRGLKLNALATLFGISGNPVSNSVPYIHLGAKLFGAKNKHIVLAQAAALMREAKRATSQEAEQQLGCSQDAWRKAIRQQIPTSADWFAFNQKRRLDIEVQGRKIHALAGIFGVTGNLQIAGSFIRMAAAIYGADDPLVAQKLEALEQREKTFSTVGYNPKKWRAAVKKVVPSCELWVNMGQREKRDLKVKTVKLSALSGIFGISGKPIRSAEVHTALAGEIYGRKHPAVLQKLQELQEKTQNEIKLGRDPDVWRAEIRKQIPTYQEWMQHTANDFGTLKICGRGFQQLCRIFDLREYVRNRSVIRELGLCIYHPFEPELAANFHEIEQKRVRFTRYRNDPESCRTMILSKINVQQWLNLARTKRITFNLEGLHLQDIADIFGIEGAPIADNEDFILLGGNIFGESDGAMQTAIAEVRENRAIRERLQSNPEAWRTAIKARMTPQEWLSKSSKSYRAFSLFGVSARGIASIFGLAGQINSHDEFIILGSTIFGVDDFHMIAAIEEIRIRREALTRLGDNLNLWSQEIRTLIPTEAEWNAMSNEKREHFQLHGRKIRAIATIFGLPGSASAFNANVFRELGNRIYNTHIQGDDAAQQ